MTGLLILVCIIPFAAYVALQFPRLQTSLAQKAASALGSRIDGDIRIGRLSIVFFNKIMAYDVSITDLKGDTLAALSKISVDISPKEFVRRGQIKVSRIVLENGCFNLVNEGHKMSNINRIFRITPKPDSLKKPVRLPELTIDQLSLKDMRFSLLNTMKDSLGQMNGRFNYNNMSISGISARINRIIIEDNTVSCRIRDLNGTDHSGYELRSLAGNFLLSSKETRLDNMHLTDSYSEINAAHLSFGYNSSKDLKDFVHKIVLSADLNNTTLDLRSIGFFAKGLEDDSLKLDITGKVSGPVCDLHTYDLQVLTGDSTGIRIGAAVKGLPDMDSTFFSLNIKHAHTATAELGKVVSSFSHKKNGMDKFAPGTMLNLSGIAYGTIHDIYSIGQITSGIGNLGYEARLADRDSAQGRSLDASLWAERLDIGAVAGTGIVGKTDFNTRISSATSPSGELNALIDSLRISRLEINGYQYRNILLMGEMQDRKANVRLVSNDEAFPTMFQSIIDLDSSGKKIERVKLYIDVPYADLKAMNIIKKGSKSSLGITAGADLLFSNNSILGNVLMDNISYANENGQYHIDSLYIRSVIMEDRNVVTVNSPVFYADYSGTDSPARIIERLKLAAQGQSLRDMIMADTSIMEKGSGQYDFHLRTSDMSQICEIIMPGLQIADNTTVDIRIDSANALDIDIQSPYISINNKSGKAYTLNGINLNAGNPGNSLSGILSVGGIRSENLTMDNCRLEVSEKSDTLMLDLAYNNADTAGMHLAAGIRFTRKAGKLMTEIDMLPSDFNLRGYRWLLEPSSVLIADRLIKVDGFRIHGDDNELLVSGTASDDPENALTVNVNNFDLSVLNAFTTNDMDIKGFLSGEMELFNCFSDIGISMEVSADSIGILGNSIGSLNVLSRRDLARNRINVLINNYKGENNPINISGYYIPERNYMNFSLALNALPLSYLSSITKDFAEISGGSLSGDIAVSGPPDMLILSSENCHIDSLDIVPVFTKVRYTLNGPVRLSQRSIDIPELLITDMHGATASLSGSITHNSFRNLYTDASLTFSDLMCLNTESTDNDKFYGTAYASGMVGLSGYLNDLFIDAQVRTEDNSSIHVPLSSSSSAASTELITFTDFSLPADSILLAASSTGSSAGTGRTRKSNIEIQAQASITQGTELLIEMNKQMGGIIRCSGNGDIDLTLNPSRNITDIRGDYTISEGSFHFALSQIQSRDFILDEGGSINFNGDIMNTNLNLGATYRTKASISTLIADTASVGSRRNVNCGIQLQGSLSNPQISFSIDIPDLDPITKGSVESALSSPDKVQKQFMALLISGSFVPDEQSGIINNSTILYSNASEIVSNQVNNFFRQLDIPLDLGLNYQPGTTTGSKDMFDVAVSYQAFNNRLIINGNVGNSETSSNWAGDFDAEIKVDKQGKLRITLFTRSADTYSNYLDNTQRSGFGITYQDEFDSFADFWRNIFYTRKRKEEYELEMMKKAEEDLLREAEEANIIKQEILKPKEDPLNLMEESGYIEYRKE